MENNGDKTMDMSDLSIVYRLNTQLPSDVMLETILVATQNAQETLGSMDHPEEFAMALAGLSSTSAVEIGVTDSTTGEHWTGSQVVEMINRIAGRIVV